MLAWLETKSPVPLFKKVVDSPYNKKIYYWQHDKNCGYLQRLQKNIPHAP
jgi:hypothetical protein